MNKTIKLTKKQAEPILNATFPEYSGRKIRLEFTKTVSFYDTNWSGGTRNHYTAIHNNDEVKEIYAPAPWLNMIEGSKAELPENILVVMHSHFCGKDIGITIFANPRYAPKWLEVKNE